LPGLIDSGHTLLWRPWQKRLARKVWGITAIMPPKGRPRPGSTENAVHFGLKVRSVRGLGLRMTRENCARINKRSFLDRWARFPGSLSSFLRSAGARR